MVFFVPLSFPDPGLKKESIISKNSIYSKKLVLKPLAIYYKLD